MFFDELLECAGIASTDQLHEPQVVSVFFRFCSVSSIVARHRSLRRSHKTRFARKMATRQIYPCTTFVATVFVASHKQPVHAWLPKRYPQPTHELPAYSERT